MKIKLYAVGNSIEVAEYSSWLSKKLTPVTEIPRANNNIAKPTIINSILKCNSPQFFLEEKNAVQYVISTANAHVFDDIFINCPVVFSVMMELKTNNQLNCIKLISAKIHHDKESSQLINLNHEIDSDYTSSFSFFTSSSQKTLTCTSENYNGDFNKLFTPIANFTFLCGNSRGLKPVNQNNTYVLPQEVTKEIWGYVAGHSLGNMG